MGDISQKERDDKVQLIIDMAQEFQSLTTRLTEAALQISEKYEQKNKKPEPMLIKQDLETAKIRIAELEWALQLLSDWPTVAESNIQPPPSDFDTEGMLEHRNKITKWIHETAGAVLKKKDRVDNC